MNRYQVRQKLIEGRTIRFFTFEFIKRLNFNHKIIFKKRIDLIVKIVSNINWYKLQITLSFGWFDGLLPFCRYFFGFLGLWSISFFSKIWNIKSAVWLSLANIRTALSTDALKFNAQKYALIHWHTAFMPWLNAIYPHFRFGRIGSPPIIPYPTPYTTEFSGTARTLRFYLLKMLIYYCDDFLGRIKNANTIYFLLLDLGFEFFPSGLWRNTSSKLVLDWTEKITGSTGNH